MSFSRVSDGGWGKDVEKYGTYMALIWCLNLCMMAIFEKIDWNEKMIQTMVDGMGDRGDPIIGSKPFRKQTASLDFDYG
jgi:hypothetical protein